MPMHLSTDATRESHQTAPSQRRQAGQATSGFSDSSAASQVLATLQKTALGSPLTTQLKNYRDLAARSPLALQPYTTQRAVDGVQAGVAQRLATDSIEQPESNSELLAPSTRKSDIVPDLTVELVDAISAARTADARREVLQRLLSYLVQKGVVDSPDLTVVTYSGWANGANQALTGYVLGANQQRIEDNTPVTITFYPSAFSGPAALYSILRHELIHAAQRMLVPDEDESDMQDDYIHEDLHTQRGRDSHQSLQIPMQEIEAHVWEINHADETGVDANHNVVTQQMLAHYIKQVTLAIYGNAQVPAPTFAYWSGYIYKTLLTARDCAEKSEDVSDAIDDLAEAIENREQALTLERAMQDQEMQQ